MKYKLVVNLFFKAVTFEGVSSGVFRDMTEFEIDSNKKGPDSDLLFQIDKGIRAGADSFQRRMGPGIYQLVSTDTMLCCPLDELTKKTGAK